MDKSSPDSGPLGPLSGVRIVGFTQWLFGPAAAQYLSDMGAEVIKVEPPRGSWERKWAGGNTFLNGVSACFLLTHRNVKSVALDLKSDEGREAALRLAASADVVLENYRPGVMAKLGLSFDDVRRVNPKVVYASASGYGTGEGPYRGLPGQDLLVQALSGMVWVGGQEGQTPRPAGAAIVDQHAGLLLATGILGALMHRERTGEGQQVEVSLLEAALDLQLEPITYHVNGGKVERPTTAVGSSFHEAPYGVYEVSDGWIALSLNAMTLVSTAFGNPPSLADLCTPEAARNRRDDIHNGIAALLADRERDKVVAELREHGVWCAPVLSYNEMLEDEGIMYLDPFWEMHDPVAGHVKLLKPPIRFGSGKPSIHRPSPTVGEHTEEVFSELGLTADDIARLSGGTDAYPDRAARTK